MRERELRRQCRQLLRGLDIQPPLDVIDLCERVGRLRNRPIRIVMHPMCVPGPFGVWIASTTTDYILCQRETTTVHQNHIILHELGHILAGHRRPEQISNPTTEPADLRLEYPDLESEMVRRALWRSAYDTEHEREAETVATIILEWASVLDPVAQQASVAQAARRTETALGDRLGWL